MSTRALRRLLWIAALLAAPLPVGGIASGVVPPLHQLELGLLALAFSVSEHARGVGPIVAGLFLAQALGWAALLWLAAHGLARLLSGLPPLTRTRAAFFLVVLGVGLAVAQPVYHTPYSARSARSSLLELYR